ncbi:hypothetical protein D9619_005553 [Psilocybe cf. subviscida]|uniref:Nucleolus and neural progenitor protein-like N-terminal domain-containing protein n=1 Tax=Psilocybe cf. subviscida TaxID=2480587 RepID=A0A8H5BXN3_9AGAR|nr:hypothetical protein D9619_005553 [Psilocybe cf. subviscida]
MAADYLPRASVEAVHYAAIDNELKSLKLLSRRIQSAIAAHLVELQILHRLFYKNKNQHRGALFWRNISEVRRYAEKLQDLDVLNAINAFRNAFHGEDSSFTGKGPWTHVPSDKMMLDFEKYCDIVSRLSEKTSTICLNAYRMFHRSMQSGAFLQVLLMFIAMASRMRLISAELVEISTSVKSCITRLRGVAVVTESVKEVKDTGENCPPGIAVADDLDVTEVVVDPTEVLNFGAEIYGTVPKPPILATTKVVEASTITSVLSESKRKKLQRRSESQGDNATPVPPRKRKRKVAKNEIDDIFGF